MARFRTEGLDELIADLDRMGQTTGELAERILMAGAEQVKRAWRKSADIHKLRLTGQLIDSIGYPRKPRRIRDLLAIDIYPQGMSTYTEDPKTGKRIERKKPVRNAEVAFINHYGTSKNPGSRWVDTADDLAGPTVEAEALRIYDEWLGQHKMK